MPRLWKPATGGGWKVYGIDIARCDSIVSQAGLLRHLMALGHAYEPKWLINNSMLNAAIGSAEVRARTRHVERAHVTTLDHVTQSLRKISRTSPPKDSKPDIKIILTP